jgi:hypothetical protein
MHCVLVTDLLKELILFAPQVFMQTTSMPKGAPFHALLLVSRELLLKLGLP